MTNDEVRRYRRACSRFSARSRRLLDIEQSNAKLRARIRELKRLRGEADRARSEAFEACARIVEERSLDSADCVAAAIRARGGKRSTRRRTRAVD